METKIEQLLNQMTLAEKASLLAGLNMWATVPVARVGVPSIQVSDGPNGVRGTDDNIGATSICFPVGVAMGATWNPELVRRVGERLAQECRAKGAHVLLAPTVNIHRTPIAGRNFECFAEDPYLSGMIASAYISGLQSQGVAACIKHFVANDQEYERFSISAEVAERPLHEIYLEPFRIALQQAQPWTLMSAYNRVNGTYVSEDDATLRAILKERWGFDGAVISDWYGTYSDDVIGGALDLEMPGPGRWMAADRVLTTVSEGRVDEAVIDDKVRRLLRLMFRVGALGDAAPAAPIIADDQGSALTRAVAAEAIVLLKNAGDLLPLCADEPQTIAVIGENAHWAQIMGGGSAQVNPHYAVSPLDGIRERVGDQVNVVYEIGTPIHRMPPLIDPAWLTAVDGQPGLTLDYFHNLTLAGAPAHTDVISKSQLSWFGAVNPFVDPHNFSLRLRGALTVPTDGAYRLQLWGVGRLRLVVDGEMVIDLWAPAADTNQQAETTLQLTAGQPVSILVEYATDPDSRWRTLRLGCVPPLPADPIAAAVDLAARSDAAIIVAGLTHAWESEGFDRESMSLVGRQDELIARVAAVNPNTIVVLNVGSPVAMPWADDVAAIVQSWYGGQEAGNALADVLFGAVNPSGKLPTTFPVRLTDNPAYINYPGENGRVHYGEGIFVGYRYYDKKEVAPRFPFGHGLSYTTFAYSNLRLHGAQFGPGDEIVVSVDVTNSGERAGQEVVQLYVHDVESRLVRPLRELKAFAKVALAPGETQTVTLTLTGQSLAYYDPAVGDWMTEPGDFTVLVGSSSRDMRLTGQFKWVDETAVVIETDPDPRRLSTVPT